MVTTAAAAAAGNLVFCLSMHLYVHPHMPAHAGTCPHMHAKLLM
jgi:hypothetical protein